METKMNELEKYRELIKTTQIISKEVVYLFHRISTVCTRVEHLIELMEFMSRKEIPHITTSNDIEVHIKRMNEDLDMIKTTINGYMSGYGYGSEFINTCSNIVVKSGGDSVFDEFYYYASMLISDCSTVGRFVKKSKKLDEESGEVMKHLLEANFSNDAIHKKLSNIMYRVGSLITALTNEMIVPIGATTFAQSEE